MEKTVTLIGMMGAGKSTVAPRVAIHLGRPVVEVDRLIEEREGTSIAALFREKGEAHFRRVESEVIAGLLAGPPAVLSLGGGAFLQDGVRAQLLDQSVVFYLATSWETLVGRLGPAAIATRPLLSESSRDPATTIRELWTRRDPIYARAHHRVPTDGRSPEEVAAEVVRLYRQA